MRGILLRFAAGVGAAALVAGGANAAEVTGIVKVLTPTQNRVTLVDGKVFTYPRSVNVSKIKPGVTVKIIYTPVNPGSLWATTFGLAGSATKIEVTDAPGAAS
jgi:hypothetical protein